MDTQPNQAKLFAKIAQVMSQLRTLEKTGRNQYDKYDYVTADAIATKLGSLLAENGIAFFPSMINVETSEYTTQKGGSNFRTVAHFQMTLACTETGATFTTLWSGEAIDRSDKSISKAAVSAVKYYLLKTFLLAGGDEDDADAESPTTGVRQNVTKSPQKATEPLDGKNTQDNPFDDNGMPTDAELEILGKWATPDDAFAWAVENKACNALEHAKNSLKALITEQFDGKFNTKNAAAVYLALLRHWSAKLAANQPQPA